MAEFNIISYNVKGLRDKVKRVTIFYFLREKVKEGIVCLQETHSSPEVHNPWKREWGNDTYFNDATSNSAGVAIILAFNRDYEILKYYQDEQGRLQIMSIAFDNNKYLVINIYNYNKEHEQVDLLVKLDDALENFGIFDDHKIILSGDFNFVYDLKLDTLGGNPTLKLNSLTQIAKMCEKLDLCDIFRVRYPTSRGFTFRIKNINICRRLDHILISNASQESVRSVKVLPSVKSDHSPILVSFKNLDEYKKGPGLWKFNNSLLQNEEFCTLLNDKIDNFFLDYNNIIDHQIRWELLKFEIRSFSITFSKTLAKDKRKRKLVMENIIKDYESKGGDFSVYMEKEYIDAKN